MHPAFWLIQQLTSGLTHPDMYINIRAIHNRPPYEENGKTIKNDTEVLYNENIRLGDFHARWYGDLLAHLTTLNTSPTKPANIYFGVNPRTSGNARSNKVEHVHGYVALYLDCDDNKNYTKEQRAFQLQFWRDYNLPPSIVVDSGHGYHVYWLLQRLEDTARGQALLKKMVLLSGCRDKGNTHDVTRILRLPGFNNVKSWWLGDTPPCTLIDPADYLEYEDSYRYDTETFEQWFPPSEYENIQAYHAAAVGTGEVENLHIRVRAAAQASVQAQLQQRAIAAGAVINNMKESVTSTAEFARMNFVPGTQQTEVKEPWSPKRTMIPPITDLKWKKGKKWMKAYAMKGWEGLTADDKDDIGKSINCDEFSPSELDHRLVYCLVEMGYNEEAIIEFWGRADLKIYREEKFKKNPNYLHMTFAKALEQVRSSVDQADGKARADAARAPEVYVKHRRTFVIKSNGMPEEIITGELVLQAKYWDEDASARIDREWFDVRCYTLNNNEEVINDMLLPAEAFASVGSFKKYACGQFLRCLTNDAAHLQRLLSHLEQVYKNIPQRKFHSQMLYREHTYIFPRFTITKDGPQAKEDAVLVEELTRKFPIYEWFEADFMPKDKLKDFVEQHWGSVLDFHLPRLVTAVLGTIAASAVKPIFEKDLKVETFNLPTINIRGSSHSGKTETVKKLLKLACVCKGRNSISTASSPFSIQRTLELTNFIPVLIDEFKLAEDNSNAKSLEFVRTLVRRIYSGESMLRGRANLDLTSFRLHCPLIIIGEHSLERVGDVSEISRVVPIDTDEFEPEKHIAQFLAMENLPLQTFAPYFYAWLLNQDPEALYNQFTAIRNETISKIRGSFAGEKIRVAHNLATILFGCRLWDAFIRSISPTAPLIEERLNPQQSLVEHIKEWSLESHQSLIVKRNENDQPEEVLSNNELFQMITTLSELRENNDKLLQDIGDVVWMDENNDTDELRLNMSAAYEIYVAYRKKHSKSAPNLSKIWTFIKSGLQRNEPWIRKSTDVRKDRNKKSRRFTIMSLSTLIGMGVWIASDVKIDTNGRTMTNGVTKNAMTSLLSP